MDTTAGADMREAWRRVALGAALFAAAACGGSSKGGSSPPGPVGTANVPPDATPAPAPTPPAPDTTAPPPATTPPATTPTPTPAPTPTPGPSAACSPVTCATAGKSCGSIDDGCGGKLFCGTCVAGQVCGAGGAANVCGAPVASCTPTTCEAQHATCGRIPNGCGGTLDCGGCTGAQTCGGGGTPNACGAPPVKGGDTRWVEYVSGAGEERVAAVRADGAGGLVVVIQLGDYSRQALVLRKLDPNRAVRWEKRLSVRDGTVALQRLAVSPAGSVLLSFYSGCNAAPCPGPDLGGGPLQGGVVKLSADGAFEWQKAFYAWEAETLAIGPDGRIAIRSEYWSNGVSFRVYDAAGAELWGASLPKNPASQLAFAPDGSLYASWYDAEAARGRLAKFDRDGKQLWTADLRGWLTRLATSGRGTPVAIGYDDLAVYEPADGALRFRKSLPLYVRDADVQPGLDDVIRVAIAGQESAGCGNLAVRVYDLAGAFRWTRAVGASEGCGGAPEATGVAVLPGGEIVVVGTMRVAADLGRGVHEVEDLSDGFLLGLAP